MVEGFPIALFFAIYIVEQGRLETGFVYHEGIGQANSLCTLRRLIVGRMSIITPMVALVKDHFNSIVEEVSFEEAQGNQPSKGA